jgi:hypothetical protein
MSRSIYDTPPLPLWMEGKTSIRQADPRWFRRVGPGALDLRKINNEVAAIMKQQAVAVVAPTTRAPKAQPRRATAGSPNRRRAAAKVAARARWDRATAEEKAEVGARLRTARQRRVKLLPACLVEGLVLDAIRRQPCGRCGRPAEPYVRHLNAGHGTPVLWRCARHNTLKRGELQAKPTCPDKEVSEP